MPRGIGAYQADSLRYGGDARGVVVDFGVGAERFEEADASGGTLQLGEIAEADRLRGTGFGARGRVIGCAGFFRDMPSAVTEVALLDDTAHPRRDIGIERLLHSRGPRRVRPVEVARVIGTGRHAVAAPEAALGHLTHDSGARIHVDGVLRADADAWRFVAALLAEHRDEASVHL